MLIATPTRDRVDSVENFHHTHMRELQRIPKIYIITFIKLSSHTYAWVATLTMSVTCIRNECMQLNLTESKHTSIGRITATISVYGSKVPRQNKTVILFLILLQCLVPLSDLIWFFQYQVQQYFWLHYNHRWFLIHIPHI